jgi:hypothetical protein
MPPLPSPAPAGCKYASLRAHILLAAHGAAQPRHAPRRSQRAAPSQQHARHSRCHPGKSRVQWFACGASRTLATKAGAKRCPSCQPVACKPASGSVHVQPRKQGLLSATKPHTNTWPTPSGTRGMWQKLRGHSVRAQPRMSVGAPRRTCTPPCRKHAATRISTRAAAGASLHSQGACMHSTHKQLPRQHNSFC